MYELDDLNMDEAVLNNIQEKKKKLQFRKK